MLSKEYINVSTTKSSSKGNKEKKKKLSNSTTHSIPALHLFSVDHFAYLVYLLINHRKTL